MSTALHEAALTTEWRVWIIDSLLAGVPPSDVAAVLSDGTTMSASTAGGQVARIRQSPAFQAAEAATQRLRKLESHLDALERMRLLSPVATEVSRRRAVSGHQFFESYYATNRPVLIEDFATGWPAVRKWSPAFLRDSFGDSWVEIMDERDDDDRYEENFEKHRREILLEEYVDTVLSSDGSNNQYLVANNELFKRAEFSALCQDMVIDPTILDTTCADGGAFFWFGPRGTVTPLHHDVENVLFVQIRGTKRFRLVSPFQSHRVYNDMSVYSQVDAARPDLERHPRFAGVHQVETLVRPGEALFIPVGWWHHVESLDVSISVSFIRFSQPNDFAWNLPNLPPDASGGAR